MKLANGVLLLACCNVPQHNFSSACCWTSLLAAALLPPLLLIGPGGDADQPTTLPSFFFLSERHPFPSIKNLLALPSRHWSACQSRLVRSRCSRWSPPAAPSKEIIRSRPWGHHHRRESEDLKLQLPPSWHWQCHDDLLNWNCYGSRTWKSENFLVFLSSQSPRGFWDLAGVGDANNSVLLPAWDRWRECWNWSFPFLERGAVGL